MAGKEHNLHSISLEASADLSAKQYYLVKLHTTEGQCALAAAQGDEIGVLQNKPKSGQDAEVMRYGTSKVVTDGSTTAIAIGDKLSSDANGKAVKKTTGRFIGTALAASSADGTIIEMLLDHGGF